MRGAKRSQLHGVRTVAVALPNLRGAGASRLERDAVAVGRISWLIVRPGRRNELDRRAGRAVDVMAWIVAGNPHAACETPYVYKVRLKRCIRGPVPPTGDPRGHSALPERQPFGRRIPGHRHSPKACVVVRAGSEHNVATVGGENGTEGRLLLKGPPPRFTYRGQIFVEIQQIEIVVQPGAEPGEGKRAAVGRKGGAGVTFGRVIGWRRQPSSFAGIHREQKYAQPPEGILLPIAHGQPTCCPETSSDRSLEKELKRGVRVSASLRSVPPRAGTRYSPFLISVRGYVPGERRCGGRPATRRHCDLQRDRWSAAAPSRAR